MSNAPLMPMATAVWLVENTTLTFKQIADYCKLHEVEVQGIADGEVAKGIVGYNPIMSGQLTREEIKLSSEDSNRPLNLKTNEIEIENSEKKEKTINRDLLYKLGVAGFAFGNVMLLPYRVIAEPSCQCTYVLGHHRPGDCVCYQRHWPPLRSTAGLFQAGTVAGLVYLLP